MLGWVHDEAGLCHVCECAWMWGVGGMGATQGPGDRKGGGELGVIGRCMS